MSAYLQLVIVLWITSMVAIGSAAFLCWAIWSLFWAIYDHLMEQRTRVQNSRADAIRTENQLHIPACFRDMKGTNR